MKDGSFDQCNTLRDLGLVRMYRLPLFSGVSKLNRFSFGTSVTEECGRLYRITVTNSPLLSLFATLAITASFTDRLIVGTVNLHVRTTCTS